MKWLLSGKEEEEGKEKLRSHELFHVGAKKTRASPLHGTAPRTHKRIDDDDDQDDRRGSGMMMREAHQRGRSATDGPRSNS